MTVRPIFCSCQLTNGPEPKLAGQTRQGILVGYIQGPCRPPPTIALAQVQAQFICLRSSLVSRYRPYMTHKQNPMKPWTEPSSVSLWLSVSLRKQESLLCSRLCSVHSLTAQTSSVVKLWYLLRLTGSVDAEYKHPVCLHVSVLHPPPPHPFLSHKP